MSGLELRFDLKFTLESTVMFVSMRPKFRRSSRVKLGDWRPFPPLESALPPRPSGGRPFPAREAGMEKYEVTHLEEAHGDGSGDGSGQDSSREDFRISTRVSRSAYYWVPQTARPCIKIASVPPAPEC